MTKKNQNLEAVEQIAKKDSIQLKKDDGKCEVMITDQFVKFEGKVYKRYDKLIICKELAKKAKRCKVL